MASSGTVTISTQSVDYNSGGAYTRGHFTLTNVVGWSVNDSGVISFTSISSTDNIGGQWGICGSTSGYGVHMEPQVSYDNGATWVALSSPFYEAAICPSLTNTVAISTQLVGQLGTHTLSGDCQLRILYYANRNPAPTASLPNAFPNSSYSAAVQVPVQVDVSWTATVRYDANGGTGAPAAQTHSQSTDSFAFTVSNTVPVRDNYRFEGWIYNDQVYHGGDSIVILKTVPTITLVAKWARFYRPGATLLKTGNTEVWHSHERANGACHIMSNVENITWKEMRTIDGDTNGQGNAPVMYRGAGNNGWYNQKRIGFEGQGV